VTDNVRPQHQRRQCHDINIITIISNISIADIRNGRNVSVKLSRQSFRVKLFSFVRRDALLKDVW